MPTAREPILLNRRARYRARKAEHRFVQLVLARAEAQRVYGASRESHNERTRNTLNHDPCSHKWWWTLKGLILGVKPSIPDLRGPEVVWRWCSAYLK